MVLPVRRMWTVVIMLKLLRQFTHFMMRLCRISDCGFLASSATDKADKATPDPKV